ncbi:putative RNA-directed DNA polymerase, partial [Tanacetum coccineum]
SGVGVDTAYLSLNTAYWSSLIQRIGSYGLPGLWFTWLYPLKTKTGFYTVLTTFIKLVQTQCSRKIKVFQSDGGTEFVNQIVRKIFDDKGTLHRFSCLHTPQQIGRVERKHRHIVETGLAMLFNAHVPPTYWIDAFITQPTSPNNELTSHTNQPTTSHPMIKRSKTRIFKHKHIADLASLTTYPLYVALASVTEPRGFKSAANNPKWVSAMNEEIQALQQNKTWKIVPRPCSINIVGMK